jgi:hypothetical protein
MPAETDTKQHCKFGGHVFIHTHNKLMANDLLLTFVHTTSEYMHIQRKIEFADVKQACKTSTQATDVCCGRLPESACRHVKAEA